MTAIGNFIVFKLAWTDGMYCVAMICQERGVFERLFGELFFADTTKIQYEFWHNLYADWNPKYNSEFRLLDV